MALPEVERVPALVVSGFLGSGKTTLVRHLLDDAQRRGARAAVISNEFGELGIDRALLGEGEETYVELDGGCVCCKLSNELVDTLEVLRRRVRPDCVIVETSGVALPYDVALNFEREPTSGWVDDPVAAVVVNAEQVAEGRDLDGTFEQQVDSADLLLLNKLDLVPGADVERVEGTLREMAPDTPVLRCTHGQVDPRVFFGPDPPRAPGAGRGDRTAHGHGDHEHEAFESQVIPVRDGVRERTLLRRLAGLGALRAKGFVRTDEGLKLVQGVGRRIELSSVDTPPPAALVGRLAIVRRGDAAPRPHAAVHAKGESP